MARTVGIGRQDFEKLQIRNNFYIDKASIDRQSYRLTMRREIDDKIYNIL